MVKNKLTIKVTEIMRHGVFGFLCVCMGVSTFFESTKLLIIGGILLVAIFLTFILKREKHDEMSIKNTALSGEKAYLLMSLMLMFYLLVKNIFNIADIKGGILYIIAGISQIIYTVVFILLESKGGE